ncbi:MAG: hypothetical protein IPO15_22015 [Anaerolineae bacterium]|uniref:hypothetical protein n=1 Tax=Candidatus Amarolinea dominans TaxID=3140696 RepID=UPI003135D2C2|nr:hypothetical protein [Anaerolineae bacterium]
MAPMIVSTWMHRGEWVAPDEIDQWLMQLETAGPGVRVNVIIEACYSGSFIDPPHRLSKSGRVVIASTTNNDLAWSSADGAVFSDLDAQPQALSVRTGPHSYLPWVQ